MKKIVVLGSGGHAKVVIETLQAMKQYEIVGVTTTDSTLKGLFFGVPVLGNDSLLPMLHSQGIQFAAIGVGGYRDNNLRKKIFNLAKSAGFECPTVIHPRAIISQTAKIGAGSVIFPGAIIHSNTIIGQNVVVATGATVDHDTTIANDVLVSAGVHVGANVKIAESSLLAIGSIIISGIQVGRGSLVAAGAVVVKDVLDNENVFGIPAKARHYDTKILIEQ